MAIKDDNEARFVGTIPEFYDRGLGPVLFEDYAAAMAERVARAAPGRVLETAAGTGIVTRAMRNSLPVGTTLVATDLNQPMLQVARQKFRPDEAVTLQPADAQDLAFADGSFDTVVCQFGIMFFPDRPKSHREALRVLRPGGRYLFSVWDAHRHNEFARLTDMLVRQTFAEDPPGFYRVPFSCAPIDPIKEDLLAAGFTEIEIEVLTIDKPVADLDLFARGLIFGNPLIDQIRARARTSPEEVHAQLVDLLGRELGRTPTVARLQTIFYSAIKPR